MEMVSEAPLEILVARRINPARPLKYKATRLPASNRSKTLNTVLNIQISRTTRAILEMVILSFLLNNVRSSFSCSFMDGVHQNYCHGELSLISDRGSLILFGDVRIYGSFLQPVCRQAGL